MAKKMYADSFKISDKTGWLIFSDAGLYALEFPKKHSSQPAGTTSKKNPLTKKLAAYFSGQKPAFNAKIDWTGYSDFQQAVLKKCQLVDYGQIITYKDLAAMIKKEKSFRAVGNALGKNRLPIIVPCHRVVRSDGSLGGFSSGIEIKKRLLKLESNG